MLRVPQTGLLHETDLGSCAGGSPSCRARLPVLLSTARRLHLRQSYGNGDIDARSHFHRDLDPNPDRDPFRNALPDAQSHVDFNSHADDDLKSHVIAHGNAASDDRSNGCTRHAGYADRDPRYPHGVGRIAGTCCDAQLIPA